MAKRKTLDDRIRHLLGEGILVPLYFVQGINVLKTKVDAMTDEELYKEFSGLFAPKQIRADITYLFTKINNFIQTQK